MRSYCKETGRIKWKKGERGWAATFPTAHGSRTVNTGTHDKREAVRLARKVKLEQRIAVRFERKIQAAFISGKAVRFDKALEEWAESCKRNHTLEDRTIRNNTVYIHAWLRFCNLTKEPTTAATETDVSKWINADDGTKLGTRMVRLSILRSFFDYLIAAGFATMNPARVVTKPNMSKLSFSQKEVAHKTPFNDDEIKRLINYIDGEIAKETIDLERIEPLLRGANKGYDIQCRINRLRFWRTAVIIARWTGLRLGDVVALEKDSLTKPGVIIVWTDKRDKRVELPLNEQLAAALASIRSTHERYLFPIEQAIASDHRRAQLSWRFSTLLCAAEIRDRSFHCLRSSFAVDAVDRLIATGKSRDEAIYIVRNLLGHSSASTTKESYLCSSVTDHSG